jgi:hypothetical protein
VLRDYRIQVVLDHMHNRRSLRRLRRILVNWPSAHRIRRTKPVHVNPTELGELGRELNCQLRMKVLGKVPKSVTERERSVVIVKQH